MKEECNEAILLVQQSILTWREKNEKRTIL